MCVLGLKEKLELEMLKSKLLEWGRAAVAVSAIPWSRICPSSRLGPAGCWMLWNSQGTQVLLNLKSSSHCHAHSTFKISPVGEFLNYINGGKKISCVLCGQSSSVLKINPLSLED